METVRPAYRRLLFNANVAWFFISHRLALAQAALEAGYEVHLCADVQSDEEIETIRRAGIHFHRVRLSRSSLQPWRDLSYLVQLGALIRRIKPDLVHNITVKPIVYGSIAARLLRRRRIVNAVSGLGYSFSGGERRGMLAVLVSFAYRLALRGANTRVIFQNPDDMNAFRKAGIIDEQQAVLIKGSGVDLRSYSYSVEPRGRPSVLLPARMLRDKGVVEFAQAAKSLIATGCHADFLLAGMADEDNPAGLSPQELTRLCSETGVKWLGHVADMRALYARVHIVCLPSYREGLPKALIEACATGRPIVTTDVPGCRDVVVDGVNGILVNPRDVDSLAQALSKLLNDPVRRIAMGMEGRRRAETAFDLRKVVALTLDLYAQMLA